MKTPLALRGGLVALGVLTLAACGRDREREGSTGDEGTPEPGGTAVIAEQHDITLPLSQVANVQLDGELSADVMNVQLLRGMWNAEEGRMEYRTADQSPVAVARRFEYLGPDSTVLRFHMRSDMRWSDGQPLRAGDFALTYEQVMQPALASPRQDHTEALDSVVAQDDSTITFFFKRRHPEMLSDASLPPTPRHVFGETTPDQLRTHPALLDPTNGKLPVSGPWMIGRWTKGQEVVLVPNPHFSPRPHLAQIVIRVVPEPTTRVVELQTGNVDMIRSVATDQIPALRAAGGIRLERETKRSYDFIAYNAKGFPAFADAEVRRALSLAIDRPRLVQALQLQDFAVPAGGPFPPVLKVYDADLLPPVPFDPQQSRQILAARGWRDTDGDSIVDKDGQPFRFTLLTNSGNQRRADAVQIIQQQWRQIGVDARLQQMEFPTMFGRLLKQDFQAALSGWVSGLNVDFIVNLYGTGGPQNITGYSNPEVDALFRQAQAQPTADAARPIWQRAAVRIVQDHPYSWLYYFDVIDPVRERLKGVHIDTYGPYQNTWEWWIPRSQQRGATAAAATDTAKPQ